jgi:hypothetical protein
MLLDTLPKALRNPLVVALNLAYFAWLFAWAVWRWLVPFWRFHDAGHGTREQRWAAYRFNREQRGMIVPCLRRWLVLATLFMLALTHFEGLMRVQHVGSWTYHALLALVAGAGVGFAFALVVLAVLLAAWIFLVRVSG